MQKQSGVHNDEVIVIYFNVSDGLTGSNVDEINRNSPKSLWRTIDHLHWWRRLQGNPAVTAGDLSH